MTFRVGDRVRNINTIDPNQGREGTVVHASNRDGDFQLRYDHAPDYPGWYIGRFFELIPAAPTRGDARTLRGKIAKRIEAYKAIENPTTAVKTVIEELEGVLAL